MHASCSDSDGLSGNPPCRRCVEHQIECVLAKSRRGGRRVKGVRGALPPSSTGSQRAISHDDAVADYRAPQTDPDIRPGWPSPQSAAQNWRGESSVESSQDTAEESRRDEDGLEGHIASTDLLNPSDALDLLAQVADLDPGGRRGSSGRVAARSRNAQGGGDGAAATTACFPPVANGVLTWPEASYLVRRCASMEPISHAPVRSWL